MGVLWGMARSRKGKTHETVFTRKTTGNKTGGNRGYDLVGHRRTTGIDADLLPGRPAEEAEEGGGTMKANCVLVLGYSKE